MISFPGPTTQSDGPASTFSKSIFIRRSTSCNNSTCWPLFSGQAILVSPEPVSLGQWHRVVAERNKKAGHLRIDHGPVERKTSPGKAQGLNIYTPMYLGGVPNMDILPKPANISEMFKGCVGEVRSQRLRRSYYSVITPCFLMIALKHVAHVRRCPSTTRRWICPTASLRASPSRSVWTAARVTAGPASTEATACQTLSTSISACARTGLKVSSPTSTILQPQLVTQTEIYFVHRSFLF